MHYRCLLTHTLRPCLWPAAAGELHTEHERAGTIHGLDDGAQVAMVCREMGRQPAGYAPVAGASKQVWDCVRMRTASAIVAHMCTLNP